MCPTSELYMSINIKFINILLPRHQRNDINIRSENNEDFIYQT
jgi:hypothetical protein